MTRKCMLFPACALIERVEQTHGSSNFSVLNPHRFKSLWMVGWTGNPCATRASVPLIHLGVTLPARNNALRCHWNLMYMVQFDVHHVEGLKSVVVRVVMYLLIGYSFNLWLNFDWQYWPLTGTRLQRLLECYHSIKSPCCEWASAKRLHLTIGHMNLHHFGSKSKPSSEIVHGMHSMIWIQTPSKHLHDHVLYAMPWLSNWHDLVPKPDLQPIRPVVSVGGDRLSSYQSCHVLSKYQRYNMSRAKRL